MLESISRNIRMYMLAQKYMWKDFLTYRAQAAVWIVIFMLSTISSVITITIIYDVSKGINGWSYYQMLVISSLANMMIGIVFYNISPQRLGREMRNGQIDQRIVKPYNPVLTILAMYGTKTSIGSVASGLAVFVYAAYMAKIHLLGIAIILGVFLLGSAALLMFILILSLASYVLFNSASYIQWITNIASRTAQYPLTIYGLPGMLLLTVALPVGLASFYPSAFIFGRISMESLLAIVLIEAVAIVVYYRISKWLISKYRSGGG